LLIVGMLFSIPVANMKLAMASLLFRFFSSARERDVRQTACARFD